MTRDAWQRGAVLLIVVLLCVIISACPGYRREGGGLHSPVALFDGANRYLVLYDREEIGDDPESRIYGKFVAGDGSVIEPEFPVSDTLSHDDRGCFSAATDTVNGRFLVAWQASSRITGRIVNADGTLFAGSFTIADTDGDWACPSAVYDGVNGRYFIAWGEGQYQASAVYARLVNADGTMTGSRIPVSDRIAFAGKLSVAFDGDDSRFLVVMDGNDRIYGQLVGSDGTVSGPTTTLTDDRTASPCLPGVGYDNVNRQFLVTWVNYPLVEGRLVGTDGLPRGTTFVVSNTGHSFSRQELVFDPVHQRYLDVLGDSGSYYYGSDAVVFGQLVNADGTLYGATADVNFRITPADAAGEWKPRAVFDAADGKFFVVSEYQPGYYSWDERGDHAGARYSDIHGRIVNADGTPAGPVIVVAQGGP